MCGIVGYIGKNSAVPYLIEGLEKLEYRGYDSAGIAVMQSGDISVTKTSGRLEKLKSLLAAKPHSQSTVGIGHTRWATHGEPNSINAHPHKSRSGLFAVVHNGIIENFASLKKQLISEGFSFTSDTDTEVIAQLLEKNYDGDLVSTVSKTAAQLEGSFALGILCREKPDCIVCTRMGSPLVLGVNENGCFIASDVTALLKYTSDVYKLDAGEIAVAREGKVEFFGKDKMPHEKSTQHITWNTCDAEKGGYEHFMLKEIMEQPAALRDTIEPRIKNSRISFDELNMTREQLLSINKIVITACGSAYHVGVSGKYVLEKLTRITVETDLASEFRYRDPIIDKNTLVIVISQSGETADSLAALRIAREKGARVLGIVNVVGSSVANESDDVLYTRAGPEIAVATTKAYSTQLALIYLFAAYFANQTGKMSDEQLEAFVKDIRTLPEKVQETIDLCTAPCENLSELFISLEHAYFIGRSLDYASAMEASLKMKEISYIHCEAYAAGELKHGTISLIETGTLVVALACCDSIFAKTVSNIKEVKARKARVLVLTTQKHADKLSDMDHSLVIPDINELLLPSLEVIPMQLMSYYASKKRGCDIDKPRNLAKSVTVE